MQGEGKLYFGDRDSAERLLLPDGLTALEAEVLVTVIVPQELLTSRGDQYDLGGPPARRTHRELAAQQVPAQHS